MLNISVEGAKALADKFAALQVQLKELHTTKLPEEFMAWQTEDMNRTITNMKVAHSGTETVISTRIWPRSRKVVRRRARKARREWKKSLRLALRQARRRAKRGMEATPITPVPPMRRFTGTRKPILREELLVRWQERMKAVTKEAMQWPRQT